MALNEAWIVFSHQVFGNMWRTPFSSRSTYAQCVEYDMNGPVRIETMFPLGESGSVLPDAYGQADINPHFFSMTPGLRSVHAAAVPVVRLGSRLTETTAPLFGAGLFRAEMIRRKT